MRGGSDATPPRTLCAGRLAMAVCLLLPGTGAFPSAQADDDLAIDAGRELYRDGRLASGEHVRGFVRGDIPVSGGQLACIGCHRRSGLGSSEGSALAPPVTGAALYRARETRREQHQVRSGSPAMRPAYTDATLRRALRDGIGADGRPLDPLMPRYVLDDAHIDALIAYLKTLGAAPSPGVDAGSLHLATAVTPGVKAEARDSMLQVLRAFFQDRNAHTRNEPGRAARAPWHLDWKFEAYREIRLHVWEIDGPPATWAAQLERAYAARPVFAMVGGIGAGDWRPVHEFCETHELPCLFPNTALPAIVPGDFYSVYFSAGMTLEGRVAARFLAERGWDEGPVLQLVDDDPAGAAAAAALRTALPSPPDDVPLSALTGHPGGDAWQALRRRYRPRVVVAWAPAAAIQPLLTAIAAHPDAAPVVLLSATLAGQPAPPSALGGRVFAIHPTALPGEPARGEARIRAWMNRRDIHPADPAIAMNAYFAATVTAGAVRMLVGNFSREYLIERVEHAAENALTSGAFPRLSLGPDQRFASKGAYVVPLEERGAEAAHAEWIVP